MHLDGSAATQYLLDLCLTIVASAAVAADKTATDGDQYCLYRWPHDPLGQSDLMAYPPPDSGTVVPISARHWLALA